MTQIYSLPAISLPWVSYWKVVSCWILSSCSVTLQHIDKRNTLRKKARINTSPICQVRMQAISDAMSMLSGKWKFHIIGTLIEGSELGFMDLLREVDGIGSKMLSKELQDLEMNNLISRTVMDTKPITVSYAITEYGKTLSPLIDEMAKWGMNYRKTVYGKEE